MNVIRAIAKSFWTPAVLAVLSAVLMVLCYGGGRYAAALGWGFACGVWLANTIDAAFANREEMNR